MYLGTELAAGVDKKALEAQREFVKKVTQGATAQQKHHILIQEAEDGSGQTLHLEDAQVITSTSDSHFSILRKSFRSGRQLSSFKTQKQYFYSNPKMT